MIKIKFDLKRIQKKLDKIEKLQEQIDKEYNRIEDIKKIILEENSCIKTVFLGKALQGNIIEQFLIIKELPQEFKETLSKPSNDWTEEEFDTYSTLEDEYLQPLWREEGNEFILEL
jgi:hypothetical protein